MATIQNIKARQILDSRGNPTIEVDLFLDNNAFGRGAVPSGASTGTFEALELRDEGTSYFGKSVYNAIDNINNTIAKNICGMDFKTLKSLDNFLIELDGSDNKSNLGANTTLAASLAFAKCLASSEGHELYSFLGKGNTTPTDIGILGKIGANTYTGLVRDSAEQKFYLIDSVTLTSATPNDVNPLQISKAVL